MRISDWSSDVCSSDLVAMAAAAGIRLTWDDLSALSDVVPLLTRIYPNGLADVNHFHAAGGMGFLIAELLDGGLLHGDVMTVWGQGLDNYRQEPKLTDDGGVVRSEEHTSELQSLMRISYAVFCLKKKNTITTNQSTHTTHKY